jgi:hypothetical protein
MSLNFEKTEREVPDVRERRRNETGVGKHVDDHREQPEAVRVNTSDGSSLAIETKHESAIETAERYGSVKSLEFGSICPRFAQPLLRAVTAATVKASKRTRMAHSIRDS